MFDSFPNGRTPNTFICASFSSEWQLVTQIHSLQELPASLCFRGFFPMPAGRLFSRKVQLSAQPQAGQVLHSSSSFSVSQKSFVGINTASS